jgi:FG-GAP repeat
MKSRHLLLSSVFTLTLRLSVLPAAEENVIYGQEAFIKASNPDPGDAFATVLAADGAWLVSGAPRESSNSTTIDIGQGNDSSVNAGAAYVYERAVDGTWSQRSYLKASTLGAGDSFGSAVAISGNTVVVGAPDEDSASLTDGTNNAAAASGAAYVFIRTGSTWTQQAYLKASNLEANDHFGTSVAISGDTIIIGAPDEDSAATGLNGDGANNALLASGAAYIFVRTGSTWSQQAYVKASNPSSGDAFGGAVALSGGTAVIGAMQEDSAAVGINGAQANEAAAGAGAAYVFVRSGSQWMQQAYVKASNTGVGDGFGIALAVDGDTLAVGADKEDSGARAVNGSEADNTATDAGAAYVFTRSAGQWMQQAYLKPESTDANDRFGQAVGLSGDRLAIGGINEDSPAVGVEGDSTVNISATANYGAAYVYLRTGATWAPEAYLKASNTGQGDLFGCSIAMLSGQIAVGARAEDSASGGINLSLLAQANDAATTAGAAYVFTLKPLSPIQVWRNLHFGVRLGKGSAANLADPDSDGVLNLAEFAFGQNPLQSDSNLTPHPVFTGGTLHLSFPAPAGVSGVTYIAETTSTLASGDWTTVPDTGTNGQHAFTVPATAATLKFFRLRVSASN